jgi:hypothetical protein
MLRSICVILLLCSASLPGSGTTRLSHFFYKDLATSSVSLEYRRIAGGTVAGYALSLDTKDDRLLKREDIDLDARTYASFPLEGKDTVTVEFGYLTGLERRTSRELGQRNGFASVRFQSSPLGGRFFGAFRTEATDYFREGSGLDNSGVSLNARYAREFGLWSVETGLRAGRFRLTEETEGRAELRLNRDRSTLDLRLEADDRGYPVPAGRETRRNRYARLRGETTIPLGMMELEMSASAFRTDRAYAQNRLKDEIRDGGTVRGLMRGSLGRFRYSGGLSLGLEKGDFSTYAGDEDREASRATLGGRYDFAQGHHLAVEGTAEMKRFTYPEGVRRDDRDERDMKVILSSGIVLGAETSLYMALQVARRDVVYLEAERSINTLKNEHYNLEAEVSHVSALVFTQRMEINALYSIFNYERDRNQLIRYLESRTSIQYPPWEPVLDVTYLYRTQDRGSYVEDQSDWVYLRAVITYENTLTGSALFLRPFGVALRAEGSWYSRHQRSQGEVDLVASERIAGLSARRGSFHFAYRVHFRENEDSFHSVDLALNARF